MSKKFSLKSLKKVKQKLIASAIIETEDATKANNFTEKFKRYLMHAINKKHAYVGGTALIVCSFLANFLNYVFSAYLGRILTFSDFALIGLMSSFLAFAGIFFGAYTFTVNYTASFLIGQKGEGAAYGFLRLIRKRSVIPTIIMTISWLLLTPLLMQFFHTTNYALFLLFGIVLLVGFINSINQGFLAAKLLFGLLAIVGIIDPVVRLTAVFVLSLFGLEQWSFATIVLSFFVVSLVGLFLIVRQKRIDKPDDISVKESFSKRLFLLSLLSGFSQVAYFTFDIILAKHYLSSASAGEYTLVSLIGKMIFFLGSLTSPFITPVISRFEGAKKNTLIPLYALLGVTALFSLVGFILLGVFGSITVPLLYGAKAQAIVPYLLIFTFGMMCYTVSGVFVNYYIVKKFYTFIFATSFLVLFQIGLIILFHQTIREIVTVMAFVLTVNLLVTTVLHLLANKVKVWEQKKAASFFLFLSRKMKSNVFNKMTGKEAF